MKQINKSPSYLVRNSYSFCFRMIIPEDLKPYFGKKELRYSLKTGYIGEAKVKARFFAGQIQLIFRLIREGILTMGKLYEDKIQEMVNRTVRVLFKTFEGVRIGKESAPSISDLETISSMSSNLITKTTKELINCDYSYASELSESTLQLYSIDYEKDSPVFRKLCREMLIGLKKFGEIEKRRQEGDYFDDIKELFPIQRDQK